MSRGERSSRASRPVPFGPAAAPGVCVPYRCSRPSWRGRTRARTRRRARHGCLSGCAVCCRCSVEPKQRQKKRARVSDESRTRGISKIDAIGWLSRGYRQGAVNQTRSAGALESAHEGDRQRQPLAAAGGSRALEGAGASDVALPRRGRTRRSGVLGRRRSGLHDDEGVGR
jgi:hypothetical protein